MPEVLPVNQPDEHAASKTPRRFSRRQALATAATAAAAGLTVNRVVEKSVPEESLPEPTQQPASDRFQHIYELRPDSIALSSESSFERQLLEQSETEEQQRIAELLLESDQKVNQAFARFTQRYGIEGAEEFHTSLEYFPYVLIFPEGQTPWRIEEQISNAEQFSGWVDGSAVVEDAYQSTTRWQTSNSHLPGAVPIYTLAKAVQETVMVNDSFRVREIIPSATAWQFHRDDAKVYLGHRGMVDPEVGLRASSQAMSSIVHELTHAAEPDIRLIKLDDQTSGPRHLSVESGNLPEVMQFNTRWYELFEQQFDFFDQRFFQAEGDTLNQWLRQSGPNALLMTMREMRAMLMADLLCPDTAQLPYQQWPEDVQATALRDLGFMLYGTRNSYDVMSEGQLLDIQQILRQHYQKAKEEMIAELAHG